MVSGLETSEGIAMGTRVWRAMPWLVSMVWLVVAAVGVLWRGVEAPGRSDVTVVVPVVLDASQRPEVAPRAAKVAPAAVRPDQPPVPPAEPERFVEELEEIPGGLGAVRRVRGILGNR